MMLGARRLLGDKLPSDIFVEYTADQGVAGYSLPGSTVLERLEVHLRETDGQTLRLRQRLTGCLLYKGLVRDRAWCRCELTLFDGLEQLAFVVIQRVFDFGLFIGRLLGHVSVRHRG